MASVKLSKAQEKTMNRLWTKQEAVAGCRTWEDVVNKNKNSENLHFYYTDDSVLSFRDYDNHVFFEVTSKGQFEEFNINGMYLIADVKNETLLKLEKLGYIEIVELDGMVDTVRILKSRA